MSAGTHLVAPHVTRSRRRELGIVLAAWAVGAYVFFHLVLTSGFDRLTGDSGDARLITLLHEHWLEVLRGNQSWRSPNFFHPVTNALGYSDTFVLDEVIYAPLRLLGMDRYLATQWMIVLMSLIGFVAFHRVCTRLVGLRTWPALALTYAFTFANNLANQAGHTQLFSVYWVPVAILLIARVPHARSRRSALAWAFAAGLFSGVLLYSTYYVGWFSLFAAALFGAGMWAQLRARPGWPGVRASLRRTRTRLAAFCGGFALPMIPFALTYVPILHQTGGRSFDEVLSLSPDVFDVANVSRHNYLWGAFLNWVTGGSGRLDRMETTNAVTPLVMLAVVVCAIALWRRRGHDLGVVGAVARSLLGVTVVLTVLPVRVGHFSLWRAIWLVVPGAKALRAIDRIEILTAMLAPLAIATSLVALGTYRAHNTGAAPRAQRLAALLALCGLLLAFEQFNTGDHTAIDHSRETALIARTPAPPPECRSFYVLNTQGRKDYELNIDAMIIAQTQHLPTLNGYSGSTPPFWDLTPSADNYAARAEGWSQRHGLTGVCSYDPADRSWDTSPFG